MLAISLIADASAQTTSNVPPLVFEHGSAKQYSFKNGVLTLRSGSGWMRSRTVLNDFVLTLEFRLEDDRTDASVGVRALVAPGRCRIAAIGCA
jgi:hypothetical protein